MVFNKEVLKAKGHENYILKSSLISSFNGIMFLGTVSFWQNLKKYKLKNEKRGNDSLHKMKKMRIGKLNN